MSLTREERQLALRVLRDSEQHVERLLTDLSEAQWLYRPAAEAWSISEIAEHVITMEGRTHETIERVLAEPVLLRELLDVKLPAPAAFSPEASALFDLIEESTGLEQSPTFAGAIELLRERGHDATVQRILSDVQDLQRLSTDELRVEVQGGIRSLLAAAQKTLLSRAVQGVSSPGDLSSEARALLQGVRVAEKSVKTG